MKTSILAAVLLMTGVAQAATQAPPLAPVQIIPAGVAVVKPAKSSSSSSDEDSVRALRQAEADFRAQPSRPVVVQPQPVAKTAPAKTVVVAPVAKPVASKPDVSNNSQLPSIPRPVIVRPVISRPAISRTSVSREVVSPIDAASVLTSRCLDQGKQVLRCMDRALNTAELQVDSKEVKLLNCREIRKFDRTIDPQLIDAFVTGRMYQLRFKETQTFNAELASAGSVSKVKTIEIEMRATFKHLNAVSALADKVCNKAEFEKIYAEAQAPAAN